MNELPGLDPDSDGPAVRYRVGVDEPLSVAVLEAFEALGVRIAATNSPLQDWIDADALDALGHSRRPFRLSTVVWGRPVVITSDEVRIYGRGD